MAVVAMAVATIGFSSHSAVADSVQLTNDEMCDLTPPDGNWAFGPDLVDSELSILGTISYDVTVPGALLACSNRFQYFDGTNIVVAVYRMPSEADADAALSALKSSAEAAAPVTGDPRVLINGKPAAREHSEVEHCGGVGYMTSSHPGGL